MKKFIAVILMMGLLMAVSCTAWAEGLSPAEAVVDNGWLIFAALCCIVVAVTVVVAFLRRPRAEQIDTLREWLLWAVMQAESYFGAETGVLKLRWVYDMFVVKFPWLAKVLSFDKFAALVDEALERMEILLEQQPELEPYVTHYAIGCTTAGVEFEETEDKE